MEKSNNENPKEIWYSQNKVLNNAKEYTLHFCSESKTSENTERYVRADIAEGLTRAAPPEVG